MEQQEPYITATPTSVLNASHVMVLDKREREFIEQWRKNPKAQALAVDPHMARLWHSLCRLAAQVHRREIEPIIAVDMVRLQAYTLNDVE